MWKVSSLAVLTGAFAVGACAVAPPSGPSVAVLPGQGKTFEAFQADDFTCRQFAAQGVGFAQPGQAAAQSAVGSAVLGTAVGAAAGALIGAAAGNPAAGAAIGAGSGLLLGAAGGANAANVSAGALQQRYDIGYIQCMAAKGNNVPTPVAGPPGISGAPVFAGPAVGPAVVGAYPAWGGWGGWGGPTVAIGIGGGWGWGWGGGWGWRGCCWGGGWGWHRGWWR